MGNSPSFTGGSQYVRVFRGQRDSNATAVVGACDTCGGDNFIGGLDVTTVGGYADSANSKVKSEIIDEAIKIANNLGLKVPTVGDDMTKAKALVAALPKDTLKINSTDTHARTCTAIAASINKIHGNEIINVKLSPEIVCQQVGEVLHSLSTGMHSEYLSIYADVKRIIKNLKVLKETLNEIRETENAKINSSSDPLLADRLTSLDDVHKLVIAEIDRQLLTLQNLMHLSFDEADTNLAGLIKANEGLSKNISKIDAKLGTEGFGKVIANVLRGMGVTAHFAAVIDRALKKVGMTMQEYASDRAPTILYDKIISGVAGKDLSPEQLHEYLKAVTLLQDNVKNNKEIAAAVAGAGDDNDDNIMIGGDEEYFHKTDMDRRVADRKSLRNILFKAFYKQINGLFNQFVASLDAMSDRVGTEIPISDQLNDLRRVLYRISDELVRNKQIYYALIGYYNDAMSKSKKDEVVADLRMVSTYVETLVEMTMYAGARQYLTPIIAHIKSITDVIDKYTSEITAKFGRGEECPYLEERSGGSDCVGGEEIGNSIFGAGITDDNIDASVKFKSKHSIVDAIRKFDYKIRFAQIKSNLSAEGKELDSYNEKYEKMIASSIADILKSARDIYEALVAELEKETYTGMNANTITGFATEAEFKNEKAAARKFLDEQWEVKKKFWATVEAVDSYMQVFTNQLVKNPDDVKEIKAMLDEIETIPDWYSELTGNETCNVFESFPRGFHATSNGPEVSTIKIEGKSHYYDSAKATAVSVPGNPYIVANPLYGLKALEAAKKTMGSLSILKNLLSVFVHIGSTFGGKELRKQIFMTPTQMYNNLVDYLQASAFAQGWKTKSNELSADKKFPDVFSNLNDKRQTLNGDFTIDSTIAATQPGQTHIGVSSAPFDVLNPTTPNNSVDKFRKRWGVWMRSTIVGLDGGDIFGFKFEDNYFVLIMKALSAKILTVTGLYDVFDRPFEYNGLSPIRMILGGSVEMPTVDPEAVPLYLRLPLLAQFYRDIFGFSGVEDPNNTWSESYLDLNARRKPEDKAIKISMVPDELGVFTALINVVFKKNKFLQTTMYNDDDTKSIIIAVNQIYQKMAAKHPKNTITETINEFVAEINRRYGIVSQYERNEYEKEFGTQYDYAKDMSYRDTDAPDNNYAILPGEEDDEIVRPSAAQRLLGSTFDVSKTKKSPYTITADHQKLVYGFRCAIDKYFENPDESFSFDNAIRSTKQKLAAEPNIEARFNIVAALIRGVDVYNKIDNMKFVLFHETVVGGLNALSAIHTVLARFKRRALCIDYAAIERAVWAAMETSKNGGPNTNMTEIGEKMLIELDVNKVITKNSRDNYYQNGDEVEAIIRRVLGQNENSLCNGGNSNNGTIKPNAVKPDGVVNNVNRDGDINVDAAGKITSNGSANSLFKLFAINQSVADYRNDYNAPNDSKDTDKGKNMEVFFRYLVNREFMMRELVELILGFSGDLGGLVTCKIEEDKVYLNYGNLRNLIDQLFAQVSHFSELLRSHISVDIMKKYMDKTIAGSYYWLHEQIMEKIINGRPESKITGHIHHGYDNLDQIAQKLSYTWQKLTKRYNVDGGSIAGGTSKPAPNGSYNSFDKVFAEMVFYDGSKPQSGLIQDGDNPGQIATDFGALNGCEVVDYLYDPYESLHFSGPAGAKMIDTRFIARFKQLYSWKEKFTLNRSALYAFNQLIAKFIQSFYDPVSGKIYNGLLTNFANGSFNRAVADPLFTYPDTLPAWFVKTNPSEYMIPSTHLLASELDDANLNEIKPYLEEATINYATTGAPFGSPHGLFSANDADINELVNGVPRLAYYILFHAAAFEIQDIFEGAKARGATSLTAAGDPEFTNVEAASVSVGAQPATFGAALALYTNNNAIPTIPQIVNYLNGHIAQFNTFINRAALPNTHLIHTRITPASIKDAIKLFPFTDSHGGTEENTAYRARLFADLWLRVSHNAGDAAGLEKIKANITSIKKTYTPSSGKLEYLVKYDDMLKSNTEFVAAKYIPNNNDFGYVVLASDERVDNAFPAGSMKGFKLGGNGEHKRDNIVNYGNRLDTDADHVLFTSLSIILKSLLTSKSTTNQAIVNMFENVADIPIYLKEKMRANLPAFKSLFKTLSVRCEAIRKIMDKCDMTRQFPITRPQHNPWPHQLKPVTTDSAQTKARFTGILDKVIEGCNSVIASIDSSMREVGDEPKFFELASGSIRDYKIQNNTDPFMPLTIALSAMTNNSVADHARFVPIHMPGSDNFKFMYGVRALLNKPTEKVTNENAPGFAQIIAGFNLITDAKLHAKSEHAAEFLSAFVAGIRFIHELKNMKGLLTSYVSIDCPNAVIRNNLNKDNLYTSGSFIRGNLITDIATIDNRSDISISSNIIKSLSSPAKPAFSIAKPLGDSIKLAESSFRDDKIKEFVGYFIEKSTNKNSLAVQNIIDLNIVPISVHALTRSIPLANLYNYGYTFDRLLIELYYGLRDENARKLINELCPSDHDINNIQSAKDMLVALLLKPYRPVKDRAERNFARQMMLGVPNNGELGRPKFLSDQLYNKALLGSQYESAAEYNEMGPAASSAVNDERTFVTRLVWETLLFLNQFGIFQNQIFRNSATKRMIQEAIVKVVVDRVYTKPTISVSDLLNELIRQVLQNPNSGLSNGRIDDGVDQATILATVAICAKKLMNNIKKSKESEQTNLITKFNSDLGNELRTNVDNTFVDNNGLIINIERLLNVHKNKSGLIDATYLGKSNGDSNKLKGVGRTDNGPNDNINVMDDSQIHATNLDYIFAKVGELRFDTVFIRNLIFITNLYRSIRMKLHRDLVYNRDVVTRALPITRADLTEFYGNAIYQHPADARTGLRASQAKYNY